MDLKKRLIRTIILSCFGLALGAAIAGLSVLMDKADSNDTGTPSMMATSIGGPYTLIDMDGKTRTDKDYAGLYKIIYFGFASCPAVCPTELQKIATAITALPAEQQKRIQPLFITIDPERDTPKILKSYVALFLPNMVGLTGSVAQIDAVKNAYKIYAAKVPDGTNTNDYTMDHSSFIYVVAPSGQIITMFKTGDNAAKITEFLKSLP
ncbi:MAG: SCO family protein [Pseudomonadota bacterium]